MDFQQAYNNIECRFINVDRQLLYLEKWEAIKERLREGEEFNVQRSEDQHGKVQEELG